MWHGKLAEHSSGSPRNLFSNQHGHSVASSLGLYFGRGNGTGGPSAHAVLGRAELRGLRGAVLEAVAEVVLAVEGVVLATRRAELAHVLKNNYLLSLVIAGETN